MSRSRAENRALSAVIAETILDRNLTAYGVAKASGVDRAVIARFLDGERGLNLATAERLCEALGLRLVEGPRPRTSTRPAPRTSAGARRGPAELATRPAPQDLDQLGD